VKAATVPRADRIWASRHNRFSRWSESSLLTVTRSKNASTGRRRWASAAIASVKASRSSAPSISPLIATSACVKQGQVPEPRNPELHQLCDEVRFGSMCAPAPTADPDRPIRIDTNLAPRRSDAPAFG
jgi:hypothetical protein